MHTNGHGPDGHIDPSAGYETRDVSLRTLVKWVIGLFIFVFFTIAATIPLFFLLVPRDEARTQRTGQNERRPTIGQPAEPVIQSHPIQDMTKFEKSQRRTLTSYGRVKEEPGKVHIPIDQAIERVLAEGLPSDSHTSAPPPPSGIDTAGDTTTSWPAARWVIGEPRGPNVTRPGVITNGLTPRTAQPASPGAPGQEEHR